jgi:hypothetical protein
MKFGLNDQELEFLLTHVVRPLQSHGAEVYLFGSRARGSQQKYSDIDILVVGSNDVSKLISNISERLEESNFPYKVDIVDDRLLAASYRASADRDKILL